MGFELLCGAPLQGRWLERVKRFLGENDLRWELDPDLTVCVLDDNRIVATGSLDGNVIKLVAVAKDCRDRGLAATVITALTREAALRGRRRLLLYTKPENDGMFGNLGFHRVAQTRHVLLMENRRSGVEQYVDSLRRLPGGAVGCIVANCDPFTNGHLYLVERAMAQCDRLYVFVLSEERGTFPASDRLELVQKGLAHLPGVVVNPSGPYMVSAATFPDYFLKDCGMAEWVGAELDLVLFARRIAPPLGITRRFVGTEPYCAVTRAYNRQMGEILPRHGIDVVEIPRLERCGSAVSASRVRGLWLGQRTEETRPLVPLSTYEYLQSLEAGHDG